MENKSLAARITEAIEHGPAKQVRIAEYCDVAIQSVGAWKRSGQITRENLRKLSEITGYRYIWLKTGEGPKLFSDSNKNREEYEINEEQGPYGAARGVVQSPSMQDLMDTLTHALANGALTEDSLKHLTNFIGSITKSNH